MIQTTEQELQAIVAQLKPYIMEYIRQYSVGVGEIELATTLEGIYSLPALMRIGGVDKVVEAPLTLLRASVDDVVEECVNAAQAANTAAQTATEAGNNAVAAVSDLEELKVTLTQAIADASSAAQAANTAKDNANTAAENAMSAASLANTSAQEAATAKKDTVKATQAANAAAQNANNAADRVTEAILDVSEEKQLAIQAAQTANTARTACEEATQECEEVIASIYGMGRLGLLVTSMKVEYPRVVPMGDNDAYINAILTPEEIYGNVLYLSDNNAVQVEPNGKINTLKTGESTVHVIPTCHVRLYQTIKIKVVEPVIYKASDGNIRLMGNGDIRKIT